MINIITGDLFTAKTNYIAHQANCQGVMGAGLAKQIRARNEDVYATYKMHCKHTKTPKDLLGKFFFNDNIITIFGQLNYGYNRNIVYTDYNALQTAFTNLHRVLPIEQSIAFPYGFGCGLANGNWDTVYRLIEICFPDREIQIIKKEMK